LSGFDVAPAQLYATSALLGNIGDEAHAELTQLGVEARGLLDGEWRGRAAVAFEQGWSQWHAGAVEVLDALQAMARLLGATSQDYAFAEEDSARGIAGVG
jgi:WXG100 family type VII secretion target